MATTLTDTQEQFLDLVRESQQTVLKAVSAWSEQTARLVPDLTALPFSQLPFQPAEVVDRSFELAEQLLAGQREFVKELLDTSTEAPAAQKATSKGGK